MARRWERCGHSQEYDGRQERGRSRRVSTTWSATWRAFRGRRCESRSSGGSNHPFVARRGIALAERRGRNTRGPQGGEFTVVVATPATRQRAAIRLDSRSSHMNALTSLGVLFHLQMVRRPAS